MDVRDVFPSGVYRGKTFADLCATTSGLQYLERWVEERDKTPAARAFEDAARVAVSGSGNRSVETLWFVLDATAELLALHLQVAGAAAVDQGLHLCAERIEIDRRSHHDHIGGKHLSDNLCRVIFLWTRLLVLAAHAASRAGVNGLVSQKNLFHTMTAFDRPLHKLIA